MRKILALGAFVTLSVGVLMSAEHRGVIKSVDGNSITITKFKKGEKGEDVTLTAAANVKVVKGKFNPETKKLEAGEPLDGGLKNAAVKAGAFVGITTDADDKTVTELRVSEGPRKKKKE